MLLGSILGKLRYYRLLSALLTVPVYWDNNVMDTNCYSYMHTATDKHPVAMLTILEDTAARSSVVDKWEDN